jgi:hypothetical protein
MKQLPGAFLSPNMRSHSQRRLLKGSAAIEDESGALLQRVRALSPTAEIGTRSIQGVTQSGDEGVATQNNHFSRTLPASRTFLDAQKAQALFNELHAGKAGKGHFFTNSALYS